MKKRVTTRFWMILAAYLFSGLVLLGDRFTPHGVAEWVLYVPIILAPVWFNNSRQVVLTCSACSVLVIVGYFLSPPGIEFFWAVLNRVFVLAALWLTAWGGVVITNRSVQLAETMRNLQREIKQRLHAEKELQEAEDRLRIAMQGIGMGTWDADVRTGIELWSKTQFYLLGYDPTPNGQGTREMWLSRIHPDDQWRVIEVREQARKEQTLYHLEYRIRRPNSPKTVWIECFGQFQYDEKGEAVRLVGVCIDITRRKDLETEVLEIGEREQRQIGQELHDGVGQELTGLGLMAQTLAQHLPEGVTEKRIVTRVIAGLNRVHQNVRELSRGLIPVHVEARGLAAALDDLAARMTEQSGISVTSECPDWVELPDHATAMQMFRIAQEAVTNALRHGRPRQIRLTLLSQPNDLRLRIKDDGIGLAPQPKKADGLGLRIMKHRAGLIGGVLEIGSSEAQGTIVTLTLPWSNSNGKKESGSVARKSENLDRG